MTVSTEDYNKEIRGWTAKVRNKLKYRIRALGKKGRGDLVRSLKSKTRTDHGEIYNVSYQFERHGIFWHKGVGNGYVMKGGRVVRGFRPKVLRKTKKPIEPVEMPGVLKRKPAAWFNNVLNRNMPELADMVAEMRADQAVEATRMLIK